MFERYLIYIESDEFGQWHAIVLAADMIYVHHITDNYPNATVAERVARAWVARQAARQVATAS